MNIFNFFLAAGSALFLVTACDSPQQNTTQSGNSIEMQNLENRPLVNDVNAEKLHFFFNIVDEQKTDSSMIYTTRSLFESDTVGVKIEVLSNIPAGVTGAGQPDEEHGFIQGAIKFASMGPESDNLVKAMQQLYEMEGAGKMTESKLEPLVFSSNNQAVDLTKNGTYSFKLFFANTVGAEAEVFAVLDLHRKAFEISEKDNSFRTQLLSAFTGK